MIFITIIFNALNFYFSIRYLGDLYGAEHDVIYTEAMSYLPVWAIQWDHWKNYSKNGIINSSEKNDSNSSSSSSSKDCSISLGANAPSISINKESTPEEEGENNIVEKSGEVEVSSSKNDINAHAFESAGGFSKQEKLVLSSGALRNKEFLIESGSLGM